MHDFRSIRGTAPLVPMLALSLSLVLGTLPAAAFDKTGFQDPLERAAPIAGAGAAAQRLTAIARAGTRLVAAGPRGLILLSDDEGRNWRQAPVPVSSDLVALHFRGARQGWASGHDGVILHTADGGASWRKQLDGVQAAAIIGRQYPDNPEARLFAQDGADKPFLDIHFISDSEGFAVGAFNLAMHTRDGGNTWQGLIERTANPKGLHLYALAQAGGELYLAGEQGLLRRWDRASARFEEVTSPSQGSFFGLLGKDRTLFAYGLQGKAFRSRDGGQSWTALGRAGSASITAATVLADGRLVLASQGGRVLASSDDGDTFADLAAPPRPMPYAGLAVAGRSGLALVGSQGVTIQQEASR